MIATLLPKSLKKPPIHLLNEDMVPIPTDEVAEKINTSFAKVGPNLAAAIPPQRQPQPPLIETAPAPDVTQPPFHLT